MRQQQEKTKVLSLRVPIGFLEKFDEFVRSEPRRTRQEVLAEVFIPAFNRHLKRQNKKAIA